jgi:hypothetical protein
VQPDDTTPAAPAYPAAPATRPTFPADPARPTFPAAAHPSTPPALRITDADRERAATLLERACGEGRLTLEEFSVRVGAVWAADDAHELARTTADLAPTPTVGTHQTVERIVTVFSGNRRHGRWRLARRMRVTNVFGETELDLREAVLGPDALAAQEVEITGKCVFGAVRVLVPEGVAAAGSPRCRGSRVPPWSWSASPSSSAR